MDGITTKEEKKEHHAVNTVSKTTQATGTGIQTTGTGMRVAGKTTQAVGAGMRVAGTGAMRAGAAASTIPVVGPLVGVPLTIAGGATAATGTGLRALGRGLDREGKTVNRLGRKVRRKGKRMSRISREMKLSSKTKLGGIGFMLMLTLAIIKDILDLFLTISGVFAIIVTPVGFLINSAIFMYLYFSDVKPTTRKIAVYASSFIIEILPGFAILPTTTINLLLIRRYDKKERKHKRKKGMRLLRSFAQPT